MSRLPLCAPSALRSFLPKLLSQGACLILPGPTMPVPIPLNECVVLSENRLLWATCHTPYGPVRPCVGQVEFSTWRLIDGADNGCQLLNTEGQIVASFIPYDQLNMTPSRAAKLQDDQVRHLRRAATDPSYARRWAQRFKEASLQPFRAVSV